MKQSSVSYYKFDDKSSCIIASLPNRSDTQVIYIDQICGTLLFSGIKGYDVFDDKESAFKFISKGRKLVQCVDAHSILGYVFSINCCYLILIEKEKPLFPIFDKHMINSIENVVFIDIPIEIRCPDSTIVNIDQLKKYPFNHSHYFSPTLDLSKDFGSRMNTVRTCWNQKLIQPFKRFFPLIPNLCVSVFQGIASYTPFVEINIGIMFLSSRLFPPLFTKSGKHHASEAGITGHEYTIDVYLIKNIGNDFEVLNHTIQVGDFPFNWSNDQSSMKNIIENAKENKKLTKAYIQRQKVFFNFDYITFVNFMNRDGIESVLYEALDASLSELNVSANELNSLLYEQDEVEWIQSMNDTPVLDDLVQNYWPTASAKIKKFGFTRSVVTNVLNAQEKANELSSDNQPYQCQVQSRQKGVCRFLFDFSFDREIIGLFFYVMKLLEIMCIDEFGLNFPEKLVVPYQIKSFLNGFVYFSGKFLLEFNLSMSNFGNLPIGEIQNLIYEYMKPSTVDFESYQINYQFFQDASNVLKSISVPSVFAVTQGPSSFIMSKNIGNHILFPFNSNIIEIPKESQPLIICLSEPCFVKYIIIRNTTATQISILGGYRLNRTFKIASKMILPWVPKNDQKIDPYICIDLESQALIYDADLRPHDYEKIRFLILKFKTFQKDPLRIGGIYVFGSSVGPSFANKKIGFANIPMQISSSKGLSSDPSFNPNAKIQKDPTDSNLQLQNSQTQPSMQLEKKNPQNPQTQPNSQKNQNTLRAQNNQDNKSVQKSKNPSKSQNLPKSQNSTPSQKVPTSQNQQNLKQAQNKPSQPTQQASPPVAKSRIDTIIQSERKRLQKKEDYIEHQKILISKGLSLDSFDLEKLLNPNKPDKEPRKTNCTKCQTKDMCNDCVTCKRPFCKKCMRLLTIGAKELPICEECFNKRQQYLLEIDKLKSCQLEAIKEQYPFIPRHNDQMIATQMKPSMYLNFVLPSTISAISDFSGFGDINRPSISMFAYEPPIPPKMMTRLPECLFTSNVNWAFESNFVPLTIIFTANSKITAIHIACLSKLECEIEGASPSRLVFEPPGSFQKVEFTGRLVNLLLSGQKIELRNIRFFGTPSFQKSEKKNTGNQNLLPFSPLKPKSVMKIVPLSSQFLKDQNMHEFAFNNSYDFTAIKFNKTNLIPREIIIEFRNDKSAEIVNLTLARVMSYSSEVQPIGIVLLPKAFNASKIKIFYPRLNPNLAAHYSTEIPDMMILQKGKAKK